MALLGLTAASRRALRRVALVGALGAGLLATMLMLVSIGQLGRVVPGTRVLDVDLGGRDVWAARRALTPALERDVTRPLAVSAPGVRLHVRPVDAGLTLDVEATLRRALAHGRRGADAPLVRLTTPLVGRDLAPVGRIDERRLAAWVEAAAARVERDAHPGDLLVDATTGTVRVVGPEGAVRVDRAASVERLRDALLDPSVTRVELVTTVELPPTDRTPIETLARTVATALRAPITLEHEGRTFVVTAEELAGLVTVIADGTGEDMTPALRITHEDVERTLGARARRTFDRSPQPARVDIPDLTSTFDAAGTATFRPVPVDATVMPGTSRTVVVPRRTAAQLERMILTGVRRDVADLLTVEPVLTTAEATQRVPTHVLGTFTTRFAAGGARTINIARLATLLDGRTVAPGGEFSVNRASGPRTCDDGFLPAGTIVRGELVDTCGGGVSQLGTTLLNAAFFAGLPLTQWQPHSFYISRYPAGREATLSYPQLDVRFRNDTDGWVVLRATTTPTSVTVTLYGRPRWEEVRAEHGPWSPPVPFTEVVRVAPDLAPGARRVVQAGGDGFGLEVTRTRIAPGATEQPPVERWRTRYLPQQRIVEVSAADAPADAAPPAADGAASGG